MTGGVYKVLLPSEICGVSFCPNTRFLPPVTIPPLLHTCLLTVSEVCVPAGTIIINPPLLTSELHLAGRGAKDVLLSVLYPATVNEAYRLTKQTRLLTQANELTRPPVSVFSSRQSGLTHLCLTNAILVAYI